ncbi:MAG: RluA family pseudouridine synthase [Spirochaetaceae bacterium]|nr:RluA family pseudouridine synthase [Spirochaetaceae bacterium]
MKSTAPYTIVYQDKHIIALNKASGISVGADRWEASKERLDTLLKEDLHADLILRVHRIDNGSSGLVVFAKDTATHKKLSLAFENRIVKKSYIAVVCGRVTWKENLCDLALIPDGNKKHLTIVDSYRGKKSLTRFRFLCSAGSLSVLAAFPETGRQHQIRVHLSKMGHPIVCDRLYGSETPVYLSGFKRAWRGDPFEEKPLISRLALHSESLLLPEYFVTPQENGSCDLLLSAPLPKDMSALITQIKKCGAGIQESALSLAESEPEQ